MPFGSGPTPTPEASQLVRLGWRWVPGVRHTYASTVVRTVGSLRTSEAQVWRYTATNLDVDGVVHLAGERLDLELRATDHGQALPADLMRQAQALATRRTPREITLALRLSGRLVSCSIEDFATALPHRLLDVHLPADAVAVGARFEERGLARTFGGALPVGADVHEDARATVRAVSSAKDGWEVELIHTARLSVGAVGPVLDLTGTTLWQTEPGVLTRRQVHARWRSGGHDGRRDVGDLDVALEHIDSR